jgi:hypothetical protein
VSVEVDGKAAYLDANEKVGDLQEALQKTVESGALDKGFSVLRTTFCRMEPGLRLLAELRVEARVAEGHPEATIRLSAGEDDLDPQEGEGPREYAARVREYIRSSQRVEANRAAVAGRVEALTKSVPEHLPGARVDGRLVRLRVVAPGPRQVGRMRHLAFGDAWRRTVYSALPSYERIGAYDDPLSRHYYSPYRDLFDWIAVGEVLAGQWAYDWVEVVHPTGRVLLRGTQGTSYDAGALEVPRDAVRVNAEGRLVVDKSIPHVAALTPAEAGSPHSPGFGGEEWTEDQDGGGG